MKISKIASNIYICLRHPVQFWAAIKIIPHIIRSFNEMTIVVDYNPMVKKEDMD